MINTIVKECVVEGLMLLTSYYKSSTTKVPPIPTPRVEAYHVSTAGQIVRTALVPPHTHPIIGSNVNT